LNSDFRGTSNAACQGKEEPVTFDKNESEADNTAVGDE